MTMLALYHEPDRRELRRWSLAALVIAALHIGAVVGLTYWYRLPPPPGTTIPSILVDLSPVSTAPETKAETPDVAPGPEMQQADAPTQPPPEPQVEETLAPTPPQQNPVVAAPPEEKPKPVPEPAKPAPVQEKVRKPVEKRPAPRTTAPQQAERTAPVQRSAVSGAAAAQASASYGAMLSAHLQRFKQYPSSANGQTGMAMVSITLSRSGHVLSSRLTRATGQAVLDGEALALIQRAQPFPAFPADMKESSKTFNVPYKFTPR